MKRGEFAIKPVGDHFEVYNTDLGFFFLHDFNFKQAHDAISRATALETQWQNFAEKYSHLAQKTAQLFRANKRILFVLSGPVQMLEAEEFCSVLKETYDLENFMVLHCPYENIDVGGIDHPKFMTDPIVYKDWPGDNESWAAVLRKYDIHPVTDDFDEFLLSNTVHI